MENAIVNKFTYLIMEARKSRQEERCEALRAIKTTLVEFLTGEGKPILDHKTFIDILNKMVKERIKAIDIYKENNRLDLIVKPEFEISVITDFLPKIATEEEINKALDDIAPNGINQKDMGKVIKEIKSIFEATDGSMVAKLVKLRIH